MTGDIPAQPFLDLDRIRIVRRVLAADLLRQAFLALPQASRPDWNARYLHGTFGERSQWSTRRAVVLAILQTAPWVPETVQRMTYMTGLRADQVADLQGWAQSESGLIGDVDEAVAKAEAAGPDEPLGSALSAWGVLPMFGFPTRVRPLRGSRPGDNLDEGVISDRPLGMAVTAFAPGAQVVKDKQLHTAVGFVEFEMKQGRVRAVDDPLGPSRKACICEDKNCGDLVLGRSITVCEVCAGPFER